MSLYVDADGKFLPKEFAERLRNCLNSSRQIFVIDEDDFIQDADAARPTLKGKWGQYDAASIARQKNVSAAALKLLLDYCESEWPNMTIEQYAAGVFHGREPREGETLFDLLPEWKSRVDASRLGLGHIYK